MVHLSQEALREGLDVNIKTSNERFFSKWMVSGGAGDLASEFYVHICGYVWVCVCECENVFFMRLAIKSKVLWNMINASVISVLQRSVRC